MLGVRVLDDAIRIGHHLAVRMRQEIYPDEHGADTWEVGNRGRVYVHIL